MSLNDEERRMLGIHYYEEAAEKGEASSATFLGTCYLNGDYGVTQDIHKAIDWFKKGADLGDRIGRQNYLRALQRLLDEQLQAMDSDESKELYEHGMAEVIGGFRNHDKERTDKGMGCLEKAVEQGNGSAATFLGTVFHEGKYGFSVDMNKAVEWYKKGAELGDPPGMSNYAIALQRGDGGLQRNDTEAFRWIKTAADAGLGIAQYNTALALHAGRGVGIDRQLAKKYFQMAAKNGIEMAEIWLYSEDYKG